MYGYDVIQLTKFCWGAFIGPARRERNAAILSPSKRSELHPRGSRPESWYNLVGTRRKITIHFRVIPEEPKLLLHLESI